MLKVHVDGCSPVSAWEVVDLCVRHAALAVAQVTKVVVTTFALLGVFATWDAAEGSLLTDGEFMKLVPLAACFITALFVIWEAIELASHRHSAITAKVTRLVASLLMFVPAVFLAHSLG